VKSVRIGIVPPLELVTCSHVFSPQLPLNQTCKLSSPNKISIARLRRQPVVLLTAILIKDRRAPYPFGYVRLVGSYELQLRPFCYSNSWRPTDSCDHCSWANPADTDVTTGVLNFTWYYVTLISHQWKVLRLLV
jgi:hypothetical protein